MARGANYRDGQKRGRERYSSRCLERRAGNRPSVASVEVIAWQELRGKVAIGYRIQRNSGRSDDYRLSEV